MKTAPVWVWPAVIALSVGIAGLASSAPPGNPVRAFVEAFFLLVCPGMAVVPLLQVDEPLTEWSLVLVVSLALDALVPSVLLFSGLWSPTWALLGLMGVSLTGACLQLARA